LAGAVMNVLPWGGPTARVVSALKLDAAEVFVPLIGPMILTALWVIFVAWRFGVRERVPHSEDGESPRRQSQQGDREQPVQPVTRGAKNHENRQEHAHHELHRRKGDEEFI